MERKLCLWFILIICILRASIVLSLSSSIRYSCYWLLHLLRLSRIDKLLLSCCWIINKNTLGVKSYCSSLRVFYFISASPNFPVLFFIFHINIKLLWDFAGNTLPIVATDGSLRRRMGKRTGGSAKCTTCFAYKKMCFWKYLFLNVRNTGDILQRIQLLHKEVLNVWQFYKINMLHKWLHKCVFKIYINHHLVAFKCG